MKNYIVTRTCLLIGMSAFNMALLPALHGQTTQTTPQNPTGSETDTKTPSDSAAQVRDSATGTGSTAASAPDTTNTKDTTNSLDKNPSTAQTDSANQAATKDPSDMNQATSGDKMASSDKGAMMSHHFSDHHFMMKAAEGGMTEIQLSQLAQKNASSSDVKDFANMMITDHSQANDELKGIAQQKGVDLPTQLNAKDQAKYDSLSKMSGADFDHAYVMDMVKDHKMTVADFKKATMASQDPDVKSFAMKTLPTIQMHLTHAESLQSQMMK